MVKKMLTEMEPYSKLLINDGEKPFWRKDEFLKTGFDSIEIKERTKLEFPMVADTNFIDQNANANFVEFEDFKTISTTGYNAEVMRAHGCGISAVYMALRTIGSDSFKSNYKTVGRFAASALSFHRNDLQLDDKKIVGTPVFNLKSGWYHDALIFLAKEIGGVEGFRMENQNLEKISSTLKFLKTKYNDVLFVASVHNEYWRLKTEKSSVSTHMVLINGIETISDGSVSKIRVTDSYVPDRPKINMWLDVDDRICKAFTGKVIFLYR
jgi:hypothetical protein